MIEQSGKSGRCLVCNGNDSDVPCAYPGAGLTGCLRDARLAAEDAGAASSETRPKQEVKWVPAEAVREPGWYWWLDWPEHSSLPADVPWAVLVVRLQNELWMAPWGSGTKKVADHGGLLAKLEPPEVPFPYPEPCASIGRLLDSPESNRTDSPFEYEAGVLARVLAEDDRTFFDAAVKAASKILDRPV